MDERGLWELFCRTGLPEAYLALAERREEQREELSETAFQPRVKEV